MEVITAVFPRPASVTLAGRPFLVDELRVGDVAELQAWLDRSHDPLAAVRPLFGAAWVDPADRGKFDAAVDLVDEGPPAWGDARAAELLATPMGLFMFLSVVLKRHQPTLTATELVDLMGAMGPGEYSSLGEAVHRVDPMDVLSRAIDRHAGTAPDPGDGSPYKWREWAYRVAESTGYTFAEMAELTLTQFFSILSGGKAPERGGRAIRPGEDVEAIARRRAAWFAGADPEPKGGA